MNVPHEIRLNTERNLLTLSYETQQYQLPAEFLRVYSPSAEVRGHGVGQEVLQTGKRFVTIASLEMTGNYALKIAFSDGHDSGLYDWDYLHHLGANQNTLWQDYLARLAAAGENREFDTSSFKSNGCDGGHCGCNH